MFQSSSESEVSKRREKKERIAFKYEVLFYALAVFLKAWA
jgi:hypothetical protein